MMWLCNRAAICWSNNTGTDCRGQTLLEDAELQLCWQSVNFLNGSAGFGLTHQFWTIVSAQQESCSSAQIVMQQWWCLWAKLSRSSKCLHHAFLRHSAWSVVVVMLISEDEVWSVGHLTYCLLAGWYYGFKCAPVALVLAWFLNCAVLLLSPKLFLGSISYSIEANSFVPRVVLSTTANHIETALSTTTLCIETVLFLNWPPCRYHPLHYCPPHKYCCLVDCLLDR